MTFHHIIMTHSFTQREWVQSMYPQSQIFDHKTEIGLDKANELNRLAKHFARNWFLDGGLTHISYKNVNLGKLFTRIFTYYFLGVLHAVYLFEQAASHYKTGQVYITDDGSYWSLTAKYLFKFNQFDVNLIQVPKAKTKRPPEKMGWKYSCKKIIARCLGMFTPRKRGEFLYSLPLRFGMPFFRRQKTGYCVREVFSFQTFWEGIRQSLFHITPHHFPILKASSEIIARIEFIKNELRNTYSSNSFFTYKNYDLWSIVENEFSRWADEELEEIVHTIDQINEMLLQLLPKAVLVDEDICVFNMLLVQSAQSHNIPTFTLLHGVPFFDVACLPLTADYLLVWGENAQKRIESLGLSANRMIQTGAPQYQDFLIFNRKKATQKVRNFFSIPLNNPILLFASQPFHTNERPDFFNSYLNPYTIHKLNHICFDVLKQNSKLHLIIKLHPSDKYLSHTLQTIQTLSDNLKARTHLIQFYDTPSLTEAADLTLTMGSTVYFEALLLRRPVLLLDRKTCRVLDFMSPHFIDIDNQAEAALQISRYLSDSKIRNQLLYDQENTLERHFKQKNQFAVQNVLKAMQNSTCSTKVKEGL